MELIDTAAAFRAAADERDELASNALVAAFALVLDALEAVPSDVPQYRALPEAALLVINNISAASRRLLDSKFALIAGEIAHRSAPELGSDGLAQRAGHKNPVQFITMTNGSSRRSATTAVQVGVLMHEAATAGDVNPTTGEVVTPERPWLAVVTEAVRAGEVSADGAEAIRNGIGQPNSAVTVQMLAGLAGELVDAARVRADGSAGLDVDRLAQLARVRREELDLDSVRVREDEEYAARGVKLFELPTGMGRMIWDMPPETFVLVKQVFDRAVSPKLKSVRFFDPTDQAKADTILADDRTPAQVGSDAFERLLLLGADANPDFLLGSGAPQIRVTTTLKALQSGQGIVRVEGYSSLFSMRSLKRLECSGGVKLMIFDEHLLPLDVGREQRLYTPQQRAVIAVKWGGCAADGCPAPISWVEIHHINEWVKDGGKTDVADGVPFCKHHHLLFHNNGWKVIRDADGRYWLIPPATVDPDQIPRELKPKTRNMVDLRNEIDAWTAGLPPEQLPRLGDSDFDSGSDSGSNSDSDSVHRREDDRAYSDRQRAQTDKSPPGSPQRPTRESSSMPAFALASVFRPTGS